LSLRDRSIVTLSALIPRNQAAKLPCYLALALDSGVRPGEISGLVTHLACYAGWANATLAVPVVKGVLDGRPNGPTPPAGATP
jgi:4-carboxymuconolactone decarboxylase